MEPREAKRIYRLALIFVSAWVLSELAPLFSLLGALAETLFPILLGILFAFLLNLPLRLLERGWDRLPLRSMRKAKRIVCLILALLLSVGFFSLLLFLLLPRLSAAVSELLALLPDGLARLWRIAEGWGIPLPEAPDAERWETVWNQILSRYGGCSEELK